MRTSLLVPLLSLIGCGAADLAAPAVGGGDASPSLQGPLAPVPSASVHVDTMACPTRGDGSFRAPFCHLQDGLDLGAASGRAVIVWPGTYEHITVRPTSGAYAVAATGVGMPTFNGADLGPGGNASVDVTFEGFRIEGATTAYGHGVSCVVSDQA